MKFMSTWTVLPGKLKEAAQTLFDMQGQHPEGVTLLGGWHKADGSGGFALFETSNPAALYEEAVWWADVLEIHTVPVVEEDDAATVLVKNFRK